MEGPFAQGAHAESRRALRADARPSGGGAHDGGRGPRLNPPRVNPVAFWFLRHGETDWNAEGRSQGSTDIPLNAVGQAQAERAARTLVGQEVATIVSSPLSRARVTAETVARALALPVAFDPELREVGFGEQEGQLMGDWYDDWIAGTYVPAGAETFAGLLARSAAAIDRATARPGPVLVVGHGAVFRALRLAFGHAPNVRTPNAVPTWCEPGEPAWTLTPATLVP